MPSILSFMIRRTLTSLSFDTMRTEQTQNWLCSSNGSRKLPTVRMRSALLGLTAPLAAVAALTFSTPATAETQALATAGFAAQGAFPARDGGTEVRIHRGMGDSDGHHRRRHRDNVVVGNWYGDDWAYYNNRSWEPDSFNDWWHDRPDRAYPAWMRRNRNCDRMWYSGDTLVC